MAQATGTSTRRQAQKRMPVLEGGAALLGLVLVMGAVAVLLYEGLSGASVPPDIAVSVEGVRNGNGGYLVEFVARNLGDQTAAQVTVQGDLREAGSAVETSEVTIDYIPDGSERRGGLFFTEDPRERQIDLRAVGYKQP